MEDQTLPVANRSRNSIVFVRTVRRALALLVAMIVVTVAAPSQAAEPYDIYVILPLTGFAAFGGQTAQATLHALEGIANKQGGIHGRPIRFVIEDDQSSPQVAVQLTNAIIAKKAPVMLGSAISAMCLAQASTVHDGPVDWCFSPVPRPPAGSFQFVTSQTTDDYLAACLRYAQGRGWKRIAVFSTTDASGADFDASLDRILALPESRGQTIVDREHFNVTDLSAAAQMSRVKSAAPDAIFGWATGTAMGTLLRAANDAGVDLPMFTTPANMLHSQLRSLNSMIPTTLLFPGTAVYAPDQLRAGPAKQAVLDFREALRANGIEADTAAVLPWDPAAIVIGALRKLGTDATAEQIRSYIAGYKGVGVSGNFDFTAHPQRGLDASTVLIVRWDKALKDLKSVSSFGGKPNRNQ